MTNPDAESQPNQPMTTTTAVKASSGDLVGRGGLGGPKNFDHRMNMALTNPAIAIIPTMKAAIANEPIWMAESANSFGTNKALPVTAWQKASSKLDTIANGLLTGVLGQ